MELLLDILRMIGVIFLVLMIFNLMIIVHEWGHFLAGRWRGLEIDRFQIWFGKPIWKKTVNGVQYGLGSIPAGGFVSLPQMVTMEGIEGEVDEERKKALPPISPLDKIIVAFAGPLFSFLLAVAFAVVVWGVGKPRTEAESTTTIGMVAADSPAEKAGLKVGDRITFIDGQEVKQFQGMTDSVLWSILSSEREKLQVQVVREGEGELTFEVERPEAKREEIDGPWYKKAWHYISARPPFRQIGIGPMRSAVVAKTMPNSPAALAGLRTADQIVAVNGEPTPQPLDVMDYPWKKGEEATLTIRRGSKEIEKTLVPRVPEIPEDYEKVLLGITFDANGVRDSIRIDPFTQVADGFRSIATTLQKVFSPKSDITAGHLSGPVGIMGVYWDLLFKHPEGWRMALWFSVVLNINLAILNLLPFPVLDGGHIVMAILEWIRKKPLPIRLLEVVQTAFVVALLGFMIFVTFKDVGDRTNGNGGGEKRQAPEFLPPSSS